MLSSLRQFLEKWKYLLLLAATYFVFECTMSWFATCQEINYGKPYDDSHQNNCTVTTGPLISIIRFIVSGSAEFLKSYEHELIAGFTVVLAISTIGLWISTNKLWGAGERQIKFIQTEFVTTHRPRLIVRHVLLLADVSPIETIVMLGHDADATGGLSVVNTGGSDARIVRGVYRIYFTKTRLPPRSPLDDRPRILFEKGTIIKRGESKIVEIGDTVDLGPPDSAGLRDIRQFETEGWNVYVMGEIRYQDDGGADHYMGFCRRRMSNGRFRPVKSPDYEYAD